MKVIPFIATSAADAVAQIRTQLGPSAVVLNVRQLPGNGIARLWQTPRIEVIACLPEDAPPDAPSELAELRQELATLRQQIPRPPASPAATSPVPPGDLLEAPSLQAGRRTECDYGGWRTGEVLENLGLLPRFAQKMVERLKIIHGQAPPESLSEEMQLLREVLRQSWPQLPPTDGNGLSRTHVLIGAPGVGKTTCLCKWLAQSVLLENLDARVVRLDGNTANTAELLSIYCDILGVPLARQLPEEDTNGATMFIDLPGANANDPQALNSLALQLKSLPKPQVHLVLNGAYEMPVLLAQIRAFSTLPVTDLIVTHLDEEQRWGKLWNFVLGTNYTLRFFSTGQNIPGDFFTASAERLLARHS